MNGITNYFEVDSYLCDSAYTPLPEIFIRYPYSLYATDFMLYNYMGSKLINCDPISLVAINPKFKLYNDDSAYDSTLDILPIRLDLFHECAHIFTLYGTIATSTDSVKAIPKRLVIHKELATEEQVNLMKDLTDRINAFRLELDMRTLEYKTDIRMAMTTRDSFPVNKLVYTRIVSIDSPRP